MPSGWISPKQRKNLYDRDADTCCYCGKVGKRYTKEVWKQNPLDVITLDHIIPQHELAQEYPDIKDFRKAIKNPHNLVTVCNGCNSSKKHTPLFLWCETKGIDYKVIQQRIAYRTSIQMRFV